MREDIIIVCEEKLASPDMGHGERAHQARAQQATQRLWLAECVLWPHQLALIHVVNDD